MTFSLLSHDKSFKFPYIREWIYVRCLCILNVPWHKTHMGCWKLLPQIEMQFRYMTAQEAHQHNISHRTSSCGWSYLWPISQACLQMVTRHSNIYMVPSSFSWLCLKLPMIYPYTFNSTSYMNVTLVWFLSEGNGQHAKEVM